MNDTDWRPVNHILQKCYLEDVVVRNNSRGLTDVQLSDMRRMLDGLSTAERRTLADPDFITEDEADLIYHDRAMKEPGRSVSLDEILAENGVPPRRHPA